METGNRNTPKAVTSTPAVYRFVQKARSSHKSKCNDAVKEQVKQTVHVHYTSKE